MPLTKIFYEPLTFTKSILICILDSFTVIRYFFSGASECPLDRQGRVLIPPSLREFAGLEKEVVVIGLANRLEIWSKKKWESFLDDSQENFESIAAKLSELEM